MLSPLIVIFIQGSNWRSPISVDRKKSSAQISLFRLSACLSKKKSTKMAIESKSELPTFLSRHAIDAAHFARNAVLLYVPTGTGAHRNDQIARFLAANTSSLALLDHHATTKTINKSATSSAIIEEKSTSFGFYWR